MSTYSFSQISTFKTCPRKYQYQYIDKLGKESKEDSLTLTLGSVFHESLEFLYKQRTNRISVSLDQLLAKYNELWIQHLAEYMETPVEADIQMFSSRGDEYLRWYYEQYAPFDTRVMGVEEWVRSQFDEQISFRGIVDRLDADGDTIVITDYKTSRRLMPDQQDTNREQLVMYAHGIRETYGRKFRHIQAALIYPHMHKEYRFTVDDDEIAEVVDKYLTIMRDIEIRKSKHENLFADGIDQFPPIAGNHCSYCPFKQICPKRKHEFTNDEVIGSDLGESTITALVGDYARVSEQVRKLEAEKKYLTTLITQWMQDKEITRRDTTDGSVGMVSRDYYGIKSDSKDEITSYLEQHKLLDQVLDIDRNKFEKLIKDGIIDLHDIQDKLSIKSSSWLTNRKAKEE